MTDLALLGGAPQRQTPFPTWPSFGDEEARGLAEVLTSGTWSAADGPHKQELEERFAAYHDATHAVAVTNGTIALEIALAACGIGAGDEVIVPAYTFLATATAVLKVNALPIFVDIDPATYNIAPDAVEAAITPRTKAVIAVHFAGQPADMDRLVAIGARHNLRIIEDAAHAHGAIWGDRHVGALGDLGCWSFQASKNMTAGEGGMVTTNDPALAERVWALHNCGRTPDGPWYEHGILGGNYRLTEFQSAILLAQLGRLPAHLAQREAAAEYLDHALAAIPGLRPVARDPRTTRHAYHLYMLRYDRERFGGLSRARFIEALRAEGIPASPGYPAPLNLQPIFANRAFDTRATGYDPAYLPTQFERLDLPATTSACDETIWLTQNLLLGTPTDLADIAAAADKIRRHTQALRESTQE